MPTDMQARPVEILLVDDSPTDVMMTREALTQARLLNRLHVVEDGIDALDFLRRQGHYASAPRPDLILLDLNLPRKNGQEVLAELKNNDDLRLIPVVILTTSQAEEDIIKSYGLHANCYISKPVDLNNFVKVVHAVESFWFGVAILPPR